MDLDIRSTRLPCDSGFLFPFLEHWIWSWFLLSYHFLLHISFSLKKTTNHFWSVVLRNTLILLIRLSRQAFIYL